MRHRKAGKKLDRRKEERLALARNLTRSLFERFGGKQEYIFTSITKAKWVKPWAERCITMGVKGYKELQKAADANGTTVGELRRQQREEKKKFKDLPPKVREHLTKSIHYRRLVASRLRHADAVTLLFEQIAPRYLERPGGYLRVLRTDKRQKGDCTLVAQLSFVGTPEQQPAAGGAPAAR